jgi:hypothetical protein
MRECWLKSSLGRATFSLTKRESLSYFLSMVPIQNGPTRELLAMVCLTYGLAAGRVLVGRSTASLAGWMLAANPC